MIIKKKIKIGSFKCNKCRCTLTKGQTYYFTRLFNSRPKQASICESCLIRLGEEINMLLINNNLNPKYLKAIKMLGRLNSSVKR
jgi:hypothetical protein